MRPLLTLPARRVPPLPAVLSTLLALALPACHPHKEEHAEHEHHQIVATGPKVQDVVLTQQYVCQIQSQRHIHVKALQAGYLEAIPVKEGQRVKQGDVLFKVVPTLYQARLDAELAEARLAQIEFNNTKRLAEGVQPIVSIQEVALAQAKLDKANAKVKLSQAELQFTSVLAPFDGIIDHLHEQQGSLLKEGDILTTLSDNEVMWAKFNVPEVRYFEYMAGEAPGRTKRSTRLDLAEARIELVLANGRTFEHDAGNSVTVEGEFNKETGNIQFRADFPNPDGLLRHGQTGNVLIRRTVKDAVVIPQRATFEVLDKRYVFVVEKGEVVRQREVVVQNELEDVFVIRKGVGAGDKIVLEGVRQVHDGEKVTYATRSADDAVSNQKKHAE